LLGALLLVLGIFPPFHIVSLSGPGASAAGPGPFDPRAVAEKLWAERMPAAIATAADARLVLAALARDPKAALAKYGRAVGLGGTTYFLIAGEAQVASADRNSIKLTVGEGALPCVIETGPVFGNTVRDGTGLLDVNAFSNSQDFNALASALNTLVEQRVLPALRGHVAAGSRVRFAGCAEVNPLDGDVRELKLVPLRAELLP
jgi:predicted lipoprotein